jgi:hypothetical protein
MPDNATQRSYGCSYGCGNPYDYVIVSVADGTTEFLCIPCFLRLAENIIEAVINPANPEVIAAVAAVGTPEQAPMRNNTVRGRGKNAPVTSEDDDLIAAFDSVITVDQLPEEFR